jgi:hypothetical protein
MDVGEWLQSLGLEKYERRFVRMRLPVRFILWRGLNCDDYGTY